MWFPAVVALKAYFESKLAELKGKVKDYSSDDSAGSGNSPREVNSSPERPPLIFKKLETLPEPKEVVSSLTALISSSPLPESDPFPCVTSLLPGMKINATELSDDSPCTPAHTPAGSKASPEQVKEQAEDAYLRQQFDLINKLLPMLTLIADLDPENPSFRANRQGYLLSVNRLYSVLVEVDKNTNKEYLNPNLKRLFPDVIFKLVADELRLLAGALPNYAFSSWEIFKRGIPVNVLKTTSPGLSSSSPEQELDDQFALEMDVATRTASKDAQRNGVSSTDFQSRRRVHSCMRLDASEQGSVGANHSTSSGFWKGRRLNASAEGDGTSVRFVSRPMAVNGRVQSAVFDSGDREALRLSQSAPSAAGSLPPGSFMESVFGGIGHRR